MKPDRRTLLIVAVVVGAAAFLSARQERRPACAGGSCFPLPLNLSVMPSNSWTAVESTNATLDSPHGEPLTNR
jgi:hypothetical protein